MAKTAKPKENKKKKGKRMASKFMKVSSKSRSSDTSKENPFEAIWSRRKFDILGKKRKGEERRIGLARSRAIDKRKNTLLKEYERSAKASVFVDNRIGESNDQLPEFDKAIMRSQRQRQLSMGKKGKFNLSDGGEDELGFSHLDEHDDYEEEAYEFEDGDDESLENKIDAVKQLSFNNEQNLENHETYEQEVNHHKTKKQVMQEVIMKSKFFKAQKASDKEENEQLVEKLDKNFALLVESPFLLPLNKSNEILQNETKKKEELMAAVKNRDLDQDKPDSYDKLLKEMSLEMRARPSERTKTPEEIAREEREQLEEMEEERKKRMMEADDSSDEEHENVTKPPRSFSGDDLGDSFGVDDELQAKKGWVDEILSREDSEDSEDESDSLMDDSDSGESDNPTDENAGVNETDALPSKPSIKDWEQSDDEDNHTFVTSSDDDEQHVDVDNEKLKISGSKNNTKSKDLDQEHLPSSKNQEIKKNMEQSEIPFVIDAPKNYEELFALLENRSNADIVTIINRIRACNAIRLASENRKKIQVFYGILLQYFAVLANTKPYNMELLNSLVKPLIEMSVEIPYFSAICARHRISRIRTQLCEAIKNNDDGCLPSFKTLSLLRLWFMAFPCSDFRHPVITPAALLICESLMRCRISSSQDMAVGSFMCSMILSVSKQSQKLYPEPVIFLKNMLTAVLDETAESSQESEFCQLTNLQTLRSMLHISANVNEIPPLNFPMIMTLPADSSFWSSPEFRSGLIFAMIETMKGFAETYKTLNCYPELFLPTSKMLFQLSQQQNMSGLLQQRLLQVHQIINTIVDEHHQFRRPLQMRKQKPVPIKLLNPKFEENYVKGRDYDPDRERSERKKLKKLIAQEAKGAARELRKDNYFLLEVKEKGRALQEEEKAERFGKTRAFLQEQEHAFKSGQLGKGRKRRR